VLLAWQGAISGKVKEVKVGHAVDSRYHSIDNKKLPPGSPPALFQDWPVSSVHDSKRAGIDGKADSELLGIVQVLSCLFLALAAIEANHENHHGLE
jgi:hypothetical protein